MGLADRFKDKIQDKDIFTSIKRVEDNDVNLKFISKPISSVNMSEKVEKLDTKVSNDALLESLETEIISKIRNTPYWEEFSIQRQEKMISSYLQTKLQMSNYEIINQEKKQFIQDVLALSNNR
jgi:hypothetical protein